MKKRTKWILAAVIVLAAGGAAMKAATGGKKGVEVRVEGVQKRDLVATVTASGNVQPHTKVDVSSDITGRITKLAVTEGQMVTKGQFLLEIDPASFQAAVDRAQAGVASSDAQLTQSRASLLQAQRKLKRELALKEANPKAVAEETIAELQSQVDIDSAAVVSSSFAVSQAKAALSNAESNLSKTHIVAPMSGRVTRLNVEEGETAIMGNLNKDAATMLTIADMSVLETKVKVDETDVSRISVGDSTIISLDAFPDTTFLGKVVKISNSAVRNTAQQGTGGGGTAQAIDYEVTIQLLNNPPATRPDFSATATIVTNVRKQVLSIPIVALTIRENEKVENSDGPVTMGGGPKPVTPGKKDVEGVFIVGADNTVTFRPVKVGITGEKHFEVLTGLKEGEKIVGGTYQAIRELKDGQLVRPTEEHNDKSGAKGEKDGGPTKKKVQ